MATTGNAPYRPAAPKLQEQDLAGKVAVVTGATKGIGRAIALNLATRGASVLGTYSSPESAHHFDTLTHTVSALYNPSSKGHDHTQDSKLHGVVADITDSAAPKAITSALSTHFEAKIDILIINAAVMQMAKTGEGKLDEDFVSRSLKGNIQFPILLVEELVKNKLFRPASRVVAISSEGVRVRRPPGGIVYSAGKGAIESMIRSWADELGTRPGMEGTTFNSVSVGFTKTSAFNNIPADIREMLAQADAKEVAVADRIGESEDVADVVGLLVSEKARWISGSVVDATGGKAKIV